MALALLQGSQDFFSGSRLDDIGGNRPAGPIGRQFFCRCSAIFFTPGADVHLGTDLQQTFRDHVADTA